MDKLLEILQEVNETVDYTKEEHLIDKGILDSLAILALVTEIENEFDIEISPINLVPANFNSMESLMAMINQIKEEQ
ncbi:acyl carrier protein [Enterococcus faecalis]|uniref:acyl carrier protein n=1 Tax=Enterococcus faecalis TaxID=1351 RepID=UPI002FBD80AD